jgi:hypothetical protein
VLSVFPFSSMTRVERYKIAFKKIGWAVHGGSEEQRGHPIVPEGEQMTTKLIISIAGIVCLVGACSSTFTLTKNGRGDHFHGNSQAKYDMLCASGDLKKVLASTPLSTERKETLYWSNCSDERSGEKVLQIYTAMTDQERSDIKRALRKDGFGINFRPC